MPVGAELEVKLAVADTRLFDLITSDPEIRSMAQGIGPVTRSFEALYYDTPGFSLQQSGFAYRVRHEGENWVETVKCDMGGSGGFSMREEWNAKVEGPEPSLNPFAGTHVGERLALVIGSEKLQLLFSTRFTRTTLLLQTAGGSQVEMALDRGTIWSGLDGTPIGELELELKSGAISELLQLSGWIAARWHLRPESKSKYSRGLEMLQTNRQNAPTFAPEKEHRELSDPTPVALVNSCVSDIFIFQTDILEQKATSESVRELRIQCRRLRSLLRIFQSALSKEAGRIHIEHLQQWGKLLGSIRDLDVLINAWDKFAARFSLIFPASEQWLNVLKERRDFLAEDIMHRIFLGELTQNIFDLQAWLYQEQESRSDVEEEQASNLLIRKMLLQSVKELREDIRTIEGTAEIKILHPFRIRAKQLRYTQEALNNIPRYRDDEFTAVLIRIQVNIGKIHDAYQIKKLLDQFDAGNVDEKYLLEKELFLSWSCRKNFENLASLSKVAEVFRRSAKIRLRSLAALRTNRGTKARHHSGAHEPSE